MHDVIPCIGAICIHDFFIGDSCTGANFALRAKKSNRYDASGLGWA